jgi:diguanylate cyclase (GGDEF)-like protein
MALATRISLRLTPLRLTPLRLTLRQWLTLPYVALVLGVALLIGALSYQAGSQAVDTVADTALLETVARIGQAIDRHVVGSAAVLEAAFPHGMPAPRSIETDLPALRSRFWIATSLHLDPNNYVYYGDRAGHFFGLWRHSARDAELRLKLRADEPRGFFRFSEIDGALAAPTRETKLYDPRERPWYKAGAQSESHTWTAIYIDFRTSELVATRARRVTDAPGALQGVVATDISLRKLNEFVRGLKTSAHAIAFIIEPDGRLIASSRTPNLRRTDAGGSERVSAADSGDAAQVAAYAQLRGWLQGGGRLDQAVTQRFDGPNGEVFQLAFDRLRDDAGLDWITVVAMPRSDFMAGVTGNVLRTALIGALAAGIALALGLWLLGGISRDLGRLAAAAREVGAGRLDAPLAVRRADEIGELADTFREMQRQLSTDALTGLVNRDALLRGIDVRIERHRRSADANRFALLFIDLDDFKAVNDRHGHAAGDRALIDFSARLRAASRGGDLVARYAGDEFVMLVDDVASPAAAAQVRAKVEALLCAQPERSDGARAAIGGTVGVAAYPEDGDSAEALVRRADADMYARKRDARAHGVSPSRSAASAAPAEL